MSVCLSTGGGVSQPTQPGAGGQVQPMGGSGPAGRGGQIQLAAGVGQVQLAGGGVRSSRGGSGPASGGGGHYTAGDMPLAFTQEDFLVILVNYFW